MNCGFLHQPSLLLLSVASASVFSRGPSTSTPLVRGQVDPVGLSLPLRPLGMHSKRRRTERTVQWRERRGLGWRSSSPRGGAVGNVARGAQAPRVVGAGLASAGGVCVRAATPTCAGGAASG